MGGAGLAHLLNLYLLVLGLLGAALAALLLVADGTLHELVALKILQRSLADQTFFLHHLYCLLSQCIAQGNGNDTEDHTAQGVQDE